MIIPFREPRPCHPQPARFLINSAKEMFSFAQQLDWYCEDDAARIQFLLRSQDIIKRTEALAAELLSYKAATTFQKMSGEG
ncbi:MAG: hypothetical protein ACT6XY_02575 [Phreatobacter sp.]|uniref:hypothetical protein n=1 Tax=Phreatobacter sp. TaxID=1966341 RepID=UPI00403631F3